MPNPEPDSPALTPDELSLLRKGATAREQSHPLPPIEPLLARWKARQSAPVDNVVSFPNAPSAAGLSLAARSGESISPESRAKIADLVRQLSAPKSDGT